MRNHSANKQKYIDSEFKEKTDKKTGEKKPYWLYKFKDLNTKRVLTYFHFDKNPILTDDGNHLLKDEVYILSGKINNIYASIYLVIENIKIDKKNQVNN